MKATTVLLAAALLLPAFASADPVTVNFTAKVKSSNGDYPAAGSTFAGTYIYDSDPSVYTLSSIPPLGNHYLGYETLDSAYGLSLQWASTPLDFTHGGIAIEVLDDLPADSVSFNVKRQNVSYNLSLFGPDTSFAGNSLPNTDWLSGLWTSGSFSVRNGLSGNVLTADILSVNVVSAVPELSAATLLLAGLGALGLMQIARRRNAVPVPSPAA